jgi:hypothetical protein
MTMSASIVRVGGAQFHTDEVQIAVANTAFRDDLLGELAHPLDGPLEEDRLDTLIVV